MKAKITITLKKGVLDPQGKAIEGALGSLGFSGIENVRQGKFIELELAETNDEGQGRGPVHVREASRQYRHRNYSTSSLHEIGGCPLSRASTASATCMRALTTITGIAPVGSGMATANCRRSISSVIPGGFSYGDYLRCGAIAARSPIMADVRAKAASGPKVLGVCNGFQILTEAGLLAGRPDAQLRAQIRLPRGEAQGREHRTFFTSRLAKGQVLRCPVAHGEGNYFADAETICSGSKARAGSCSAMPMTPIPTAPSIDIAGIMNEAGNVIGLMPHPENMIEPLHGATDCRPLFESLRWRHEGRKSHVAPGRLDTTEQDPNGHHPELVREHGLKPDEYERILELIGREPTITELGIFSAMWNEHCSYKSSKKWLKTLPTSGARVIQGPGENAGVVDFGDGDAIIFKMESHNHPSFIEPYQGAATGVGGILRDVFTMGARPIAALNALRFGAPSHPRRPGSSLPASSPASAAMAISFGVPTVGGEVNFHPRYNGNILVNAMAVGIAQKRPDLLLQGRGRGTAGRLSRRQDGPRRHSRRHHGFGRVRRRRRGEAPDGPGRRSLHREMPARGLPRAHGARAPSSPSRIWGRQV